MAEGVTGKDRGEDVSGWYGQVGHPLLPNTPKHCNLLFAKYDTYDENRDVPNDLFHRWSLGYWYELDPCTRVYLGVAMMHDGAEVHRLRNVQRKRRLTCSSK